MTAGNHFDPDGAAPPDSGIFGLPHTREQSRVLLLPVPFDATTSYGAGTARGPEAIRDASRQVDLCDAHFGRVHEHGIFLENPGPEIQDLSVRARALAEPIIERGGAEPSDGSVVEEIDAACEWVRSLVRQRVQAVLEEGKIPGLIGGEHSVSLGAIEACAEAAGPLGVLQIDAHLDLREAYEGFRHSHASIVHNVLREAPWVERVVQVGVRDFSEGEWEARDTHAGRVLTLLDVDYHRWVAEGNPKLKLLRETLGALPDAVYVTFDIDGLDPSLCPNTGTPVPGGLSFNDAALLLQELHDSGRRVVGFDLVEVAPGPDANDEWDANVGARVLYKLCGCAAGARTYRSPTSGISSGTT